MSVVRANYPGFLVWICGLAASSIPASAQDPATPLMPKHPTELLLLAQKQNRLTNQDIRPWHLKISVKQWDKSGNLTVESNIEEFWAGASKHKVIYTTPTTSMTEYVTEKGLFRSAADQIPPGPLSQAKDAVINPIYEDENLIEKWVLDRENLKENGVKLVCVTRKGIKDGSKKYESIGSTYCLDPVKPSLLSRSNPIGSSAKAVYTRSNIQDFHGYYVPQDVELTVSGRPTLKAHLDLIEDLAESDNALFSPPSDAAHTPMGNTVSLSAGISRATFLFGNPPEYPGAAKAAGISGTVVLEAKITKDGSVSDIKAVSGPQELQQAAIDAVRTWKYKPYLLNDEPVEVRTRVNVVFQPKR